MTKDDLITYSLFGMFFPYVALSKLAEVVNKDTEKEKEEKKKEEKPTVQTSTCQNVPPKKPCVEVELPFPNDYSPIKYVNSLAHKLNTSNQTVVGILYDILTLNPGAFLNIVLREVALELDTAYSNNIKDVQTIYTFNPIDAKIYCQDASRIKPVAYKYFAAFRTHEDAVYAIKMVGQVKKFVIECVKGK